MPKIVDHEARRQLLSDAAWRVIARDGIDNVTVRKIADESGYSPGTLAHYFTDKDAILRSTLERADDNIRLRIEAMPEDLPPLTSLRQVLCEALPLDEERSFELTLDVNFWARALNQPTLRTMQHADHDAWRASVMERVAATQEAGEFPAHASVEDLADLLVAFIDGIGLQALIYPELVTTDRVIHLLDRQIELMTGATP